MNTYEIIDENIRYTAYILNTPDGKTSDILGVFKEVETRTETTLVLLDWRYGASLMTDDEITNFMRTAMKK